ncbi:hypothetical protein N0V85_009643 [Neurospora sp. IMI 360204]|nr:hypothetical protein N0V85_009643 [Neurospora sp. IMI 360204]
MHERIEDNKDGTGHQLHDDIDGLVKFAGDTNTMPPNHPVFPAPHNWPLDENQEFSTSSSNTQLPFTPERAFDLKVFEYLKFGHSAYQLAYELASEFSKIPGVTAWNWIRNPHAAGESISMTASGVDVTMEVCNNPNQCELPPDMAESLQRFSIPHICEYEQAERLLRNKVFNTALQMAAPYMLALLEEELQKRMAEMDMEEYDEDMGSEFEAKL